MKLQNLVEQSYETFVAQAPNARVILLHPQSRYRSVLVAKLINTPDVHCIYYALGPDDINVQSFLSGVTHDIANQHPTFGRHTNMMPGSIYADRERFGEIVETFARDLAEVSDEEFYFILDEYDRGDTADDIQRFVDTLIDVLPAQCRIVLNSRTLPRLPWVSLVAQHKAVLLRDDELIMTDFYGIEPGGKNRLDIFALGPGYVLMDDEPIDTWEGHLPRLLFFFALDRPIVTRSEICQAFWPDLETDQAVNVFHVTKRRLHKALDMDVLVHDEGYYRVNPELEINYDVMDFVTLLMEGREQSDERARIKAWQAAIDLYRGPFLQGHSDDWIEARRTDFQRGYLEALTAMGHVRLDEGRKEHALSLFQKALGEDNSREELHRQVMKMYADMGRRSEAAAHYQKLVEDLKDQHREPEADTVNLYADIMS